MIVVALFGFYLMISYHQRLTGDDFFFLNNLTEKGWYDGVMAFEYNRRFSSHLLFNSIFVSNTDLKTLHFQLFGFQVLTFISLLMAMAFMIRKLLFRMHATIAKQDAILLSGLVISALFFFTFQLNEVWFWTISSTIHLVPLIFICLGAGILMKEEKGVLDHSFIFLCFLFVGGASETMALSSLSVLGIIAIHRLIHQKGKWMESTNVGLLVAMIGIIVFFSMNILGSGATDRLDIEATEVVSPYIVSIAGFIGIFMQAKNLVFLLFLGLFLFLGSHMRSNGFELKLTKKTVLRMLGLLVVIVLTTFGPLYFVFDSLGPPRAWTPFGIYLSLLLIVGAFYVGNRKGLSIKPIAISGVSMIIIGLIFTYTYRQEPVVRRYSQAYDHRTETLTKMNKNGRVDSLKVGQLPSPGMLVSGELKGGTNSLSCQNLKKVLALKFDLYVQEATAQE